MSGRRTWADGLASFAGIALALAACGARSSDDMQLLTSAEWKDDPGSTAEIGFWVSVDVGWNSRVDSCSPLSAAVHVTVDDHEAEYVPYSTGDCVWDALFEAGPFAADEPGPVVIRVLDGAALLGEASFEEMFPGYAARLLRPADGELRLGDSLAVGLLAPLPAEVEPFNAAEYNWLDPADSVPPFHTYAQATLESDRQSMTIEAPALTGRAAVTVVTLAQRTVAAQSCTGFVSCIGLPSRTLGPVLVVP